MEIEATVWADICYKDYDEAREILKENKIDASYMESGKTIMNLISETLEVDIAKTLLDMGADINIKDEWGNIPIITAIYKFEDRDFEDDSMIRLLISNGGGKDFNNKYFESVIKEINRIKQVLNVMAPEKLEQLDWINEIYTKIIK